MGWSGRGEPWNSIRRTQTFSTTQPAHSPYPVNLEKQSPAWRSRFRFALIENGSTMIAISIRCVVSPDFRSYCGSPNQRSQYEEDNSANSIPPHIGRSPARLGRGGRGARADQGRELADPPRVRMGEPGLATLDPLLQRPLPLRALRRARAAG